MKKIEPYKGIAGTYEEIRPSYPEKLIQDVISKTDLKLNDMLLEIGAGTGKATIQFADKGFRVQAIELGEDMAEILKDKCNTYPDVSVDVVSFEEWNCPNNQKYDMIYSAQAFHWIDKSIKYKKCHELLKDNGYLVLFWYNPCDDKLPATIIIEEKVERIIEKYVSKYFTAKRKPERCAHDGVSNNDERKTEIEESGLFDLVEKVEYTQEVRNNPSQYLKVIKSVPAFASTLDGLDNKIIENMDSEIEEVINNHGGYVNGLFEFSLYITKKI
ncbi:bifunctional 2-polyprenyl-6-hydroxyphenol methylase/3-demethylubiquinol 3-O-methyltransferase UbiG [Clostridium sp. CF012]|uniref:class I SAM-dependent methyltransferase n=1 Tax=Clostridium sp. CF012 TaxID=2843319 RepID=UPI001C0C8DEC|nr:class I SAM-dependent methyltransferase [Clostridium sp. CF012]MBU3145662.1 class I SAM-dependent methyltransferase [Clostridium sp. CF012]